MADGLTGRMERSGRVAPVAVVEVGIERQT